MKASKALLLLLSLFSLLFGGNAVIAQNKFLAQYIPTVGAPIKDYTYLDLRNHDSKTYKISDGRGKWLVIYMWSQTCTGCIASMPKVNKMSLDFKKSANFLLVGYYKPSSKHDNRIKSIYDLLTKRHNLTMTAAFDSASFSIFGAQAVPLIFVIDPNGIIKAKTFSIDSTLLAGLIEGKNMPFQYAYTVGEGNGVKWDYDRPFLTNGTMANGGIDTNFLYRSIISNWTPRMPSGIVGFYSGEHKTIKWLKEGNAYAMGISLSKLVCLAITGLTTFVHPDGPDSLVYRTYYPDPIVESSNVDLFDRPNRATGAGVYSYSINSPGFSEEKLRKILLSDLENVFNFKVTIEEREVPAWKLVIVDEAKFKRSISNNDTLEIYYDDKKGEAFYKGISSDGLTTGILRSAAAYKDMEDKQYAFAMIEDATGRSEKFNLRMTKNIFLFDEVLKNLKSCGLSLVKGTTKRKCFIIKNKSL